MLLTFENYVSEKESFRPQSEHYSLSKNPSKTSSKFYPYLVDIQSNYISEIDTRIVIPLGRVESFKNQIMKKLQLEIHYKDEALVLMNPQIASISKKLLKSPLGSLEHLKQEIIDALDFAITGIQ